jgi:hypothetical protein
MSVVRESSLKVVEIHVDALVLNPANSNEMDEVTLNRLVDEIREVGMLDPIDVVPSSEPDKYFILGGEHRLKASMIVGLSYVPAIIHTEEKWSDRDLFDLVAFRLNVLKGSQNPEKFIKLYDRMALKFGPEPLQEIFAVTDSALWKKMTKAIRKDLKKAGMDDETLEHVAEAEKKAKDFNQFTKYLNKIFESQALATKTNAIIFVNQEKENFLIEASDDLFACVKTLYQMATEKQKVMSDVLEPIFRKALVELEKPEP